MVEAMNPETSADLGPDEGQAQPLQETAARRRPITQFHRPLDEDRDSPPVALRADADQTPGAASDASQDDLERIREIIMGNPDAKRQPVREAEANRMRDILFGPKMEEYERRFADLRRELDRVANDLLKIRDAMEEFRAAHQERLAGAEREMQQALEELKRELERLRSQGPLLQKLVPQTQQLQVRVSQHDKDVSEIRAALVREGQEVHNLRSLVEQYREQYERGSEALKRETRQGEDELKEEIRRVADRLDDKKTDRQVLAAVLLEMAARLETGSGAMGMLADIAAPEE